MPSPPGLTTSYGHNRIPPPPTTTASTPTISFPVIGISIGVPVPTTPGIWSLGFCPAAFPHTLLDLACLLAIFCLLFSSCLLGLGSSHFSLCHQYMIPPQLFRLSVGFGFGFGFAFAANIFLVVIHLWGA
jgi:hypothetical protein